MKKTLVILAIIMASSSVSFAQRAIGLRWGMNSHLVNGMGTELSYQQVLDNNRLEIDFGMAGIFGHAVDKNHSFILSLSAAYHWKFGIGKGFSWYVGPAASTGLYFVQLDKSFEGAVLGIGGQVGIEYNFSSIPFQLSLDTRPMVNLLAPKPTRGFNIGVCLSVRYMF